MKVTHGFVSVMICSNLAGLALAQDPDEVRYRLGLNGTYTPPLPPACKLLCPPIGVAYIHGNEANDQTFNPHTTPELRWDAVGEVSGPNQGAANLVINLEVHRGTIDGELMTQVIFTGNQYNDPLNFSYSFTAKPDMVGRLNDPVAIGGPNLALSTTGLAAPMENAEDGKLSAAGAGYTSWDGSFFERPGVGRLTLPNGKPGFGYVPIFDGKIRIADLPDARYVLMLIQGTGVNVLENDIDLTQYQGHFAKRASSRPDTSISFIVARPHSGGGNSGGNSGGSGGTPPPDNGSGQTQPPDNGGSSTGGGTTPHTDAGTNTPPPGSDASTATDGQPATTDQPTAQPVRSCGCGLSPALMLSLLGLLTVRGCRRRRAHR